MDVTFENVDEYINLVVDFTVGRGVRRQIDEFKKGFSSVFPYEALCAFTADELGMLFGKSDEDWSYDSNDPIHSDSNSSPGGLCKGRSWI
jgi:E3 ubiquitin-protein ligase TRIP12